MGYYTDWFLADDSDAEAIASIVMTEEHSFEEWPNLGLKNIGEMELMELWSILRGDPSKSKSVSGDLLFQGSEEGPFVCRVVPEFIEELARIQKPELKGLIGRWANSQGLSDWPPGDLSTALSNLVEFAKRAKRENKSVLQMNVL